MENKKVQVEIALKDNLSKQLDSLSSKVKKVAKDMQNSVRSMQNSFNNIKINNSGMDSSISDIKKKLKSLGNESVEIDANVNVDTSAVDGLSSGAGIDVGAIGMMGGVSSSMKGITSSVQQMGSSLQQAFSAGIQDTESYQNKIRQVTNAFKELQNLNKTNSPILEQGFDRKKLESLRSEVVGLIAYFEQFEGEVVSATDALNALNSMQDSVYGQKGNLNKSSKNQISKDISEMTKNAVPKQGIEIPISIKNIAEAKAKVAELEGNLKRDKIQLNVDDGRLNKALLNYKNRILELKGKLAGATAIGDTKGMEIYQHQIANTIKQITDLNNKVKEHKKIQSDLVNQIKNLKNGSLKSSIAEALGGGESTQKSGNMISNVIDKIKNKFKELTKATNETKKSTEGVKKSLSGFKSILASMGLAFGINQLINFSKSCVDIASSIAEVQNVLDTVFRVKIDGILHDSAETVNKWAEECSSAFGMTTLQAKKFASNFGAMLTASDVNFDYIDEMSIKLTQLAGDLGSFYNISTESAFEKLQSGLAGMVMPLRELGISMTVANLEAFALSRGITTAYNEMSQADQQILRYNYLMQQTQMVMGDFSRTQYSYANSVRTLKNSFGSLKAEIGQSMIACLAPVIKVISTIIAYLTALARAFNNFLRSIGLLKGAVGGVGDTIREIATGGAGIGDVGDAIGGVGDSAGGSAEKVADLAKEIKGLMGIDQLNKLPEISDSASGGSGAGGSGGGAGGAGGGADIGDLGLTPDDLSDYNGKLESELDRISKMVQAWLNTFNFNPLIESFKRFGSAISTALQPVGKLIGWFLKDVLDPLAHFTIESILPNFFDTLSGILEILSPILKNAVDAFIIFNEIVLIPIAKFTGGVFVKVWEAINTVLEKIGNFFNSNPIGQKIAEVMGTIVGVLAGIGETILIVVGVIKTVTTVASGISKAVSLVTSAFSLLTSPVGLVIAGIVALIAIIVLCVKHWDKIKEVASNVWEAIKNAWGTAWSWFKSTVVDPIVEVFSTCWDTVSNVVTVAVMLIQSIWNGIVDFFSGLWDNVVTVFTSYVDLIKQLFEAWIIALKTVWTPIIKFFKDVWDSIVNALSPVIDSVVDFFKKAWESIKNVWKVVCSWFKTTVLTPVQNAFNTVWDAIKNIVSKAWEGIKTLWKVAKDWFNNTVINPIKNVFSTGWDAIKNFASSAWSGVQNIWNRAKDWFSNIFEDVKSVIKSKFDGIITPITNTFNTVKSTVSGAIDKIKSYFNFSWSLPKLKLPHFSIKGSFSLNPPSVPSFGIEWYKHGGIMTDPTLFGINGAKAMVGGEAGAEGIIPLSTLWKQLDNFADKIVSGIMSNNNGQDLTVNLLLDGKIVTATVVKNINNQTRLTGVSPLK